ncbi:MAG: alanine:cation symporter family protein, partial [Candidatus Methanomethylophilaceae archaeon]|nr:alanine:cation symporter family protein [Candidatus Methanomethylophilaceae archaeon]
MDVTNTVFVKVNERQASAPAPVMGIITATPRATEPRVYDFVISGYSNASNIIWSYEGKVFATSSPTALYEFPASGSYTVKCTLAGFDGSFVSEEIDLVCLDNYHRDAAWTGIQYSYVIESDEDVSIQSGAPFSVVTSQVDGKTYRMISGIPSEAEIGERFTVNVGDDSWSIQVYASESAAPVEDFDLVLSDDGYTVVALFKGQNASFYSYDFDGDGIPEQGNAFTYQKEGRYTVVCKAVNNVSETSKSDMVSINVVPHEDVDVSELTDFEMVVGERLDVILSVDEGVPITVSGSAAGFVTVLDGVLRAEPTEKGVFDLTVSVHNGTQATVSKTIKITVRGTEIQDLEEEKHDYMVVMAVFFIIGSLIIIIMNIGMVPAAFGAIFQGAFNFQSAAGGVGGAMSWFDLAGLDPSLMTGSSALNLLWVLVAMLVVTVLAIACGYQFVRRQVEMIVVSLIAPLTAVYSATEDDSNQVGDLLKQLFALVCQQWLQYVLVMVAVGFGQAWRSDST